MDKAAVVQEWREALSKEFNVVLTELDLYLSKHDIEEASDKEIYYLQAGLSNTFFVLQTTEHLFRILAADLSEVLPESREDAAVYLNKLIEGYAKLGVDAEVIE